MATRAGTAPKNFGLIGLVLVALALGFYEPALKAQDMSPDRMKRKASISNILGINALLYGKYHLHGEEEEDEHSEEENGHDDAHGHGELGEGLGIQSVEFAIAADIDSYLRMMAVAAYHGAWEFEEIFVANQKPLFRSLGLKVGRFFPIVGKYNNVHEHALPFINKSLHHEELLGAEGLLEFGVEAQYLFPFPFFMELTVAWIQSRNEALFLFDGGKEEPFPSGASPSHIRVLFDLSDDATLELGFSQVIGANNFSVWTGNSSSNPAEGVSVTSLYGMDLTFKWLDTGRNISGLTLSVEGAMRTVSDNTYKDAEVEETLGGWHALAQYKFLKRFHAQYRYAVGGLFTDHDHDVKQVHSTLFAFVPSEFSVFRIQYDLTSHDDEFSGELIGQLNFSIGAHPAHSY